MINDYWEEKNISLDIAQFHEEELKKWGIPKWMNVKCPFCNKELPLRSIRSIGFKLNTRNMGDIILEVMCDSCSKMDTVYFHKQVESVKDFIPFLTGEKVPSSESIIEEKMYKMQYNNVVDKMMTGMGATKVQYDVGEEVK
jgi:hypothetical protein